MQVSQLHLEKIYCMLKQNSTSVAHGLSISEGRTKVLNKGNQEHAALTFLKVHLNDLFAGFKYSEKQDALLFVQSATFSLMVLIVEQMIFKAERSLALNIFTKNHLHTLKCKVCSNSFKFSSANLDRWISCLLNLRCGYDQLELAYMGLTHMDQLVQLFQFYWREVYVVPKQMCGNSGCKINPNATVLCCGDPMASHMEVNFPGFIEILQKMLTTELIIGDALS